ncbi:phosphoribosyl-AMP cyclohydrolase [Erythrobacter sp. W53]|uniref:phosphoribosyl-AMP cyclohydrolase n=1 Tax=Erythrobacter sp. W53 TaxID=3425947 RepID=UPI003D76A407
MSLQDSDRETGSRLLPKFDEKGLLSAVVTDSEDGEVLMVAFMNAEALAATQETGFAHFYSRSRKVQWMKGETSGNRLAVERILIDCDQDAVVIKARAEGPTCHTGVRSCFYRELKNGALVPVKT